MGGIVIGLGVTISHPPPNSSSSLEVLVVETAAHSKSPPLVSAAGSV